MDFHQNETLVDFKHVKEIAAQVLLELESLNKTIKENVENPLVISLLSRKVEKITCLMSSFRKTIESPPFPTNVAQISKDLAIPPDNPAKGCTPMETIENLYSDVITTQKI